MEDMMAKSDENSLKVIKVDGVHIEHQHETPHYDWKDITQEFMEASEDLQLGELLHDANFGLFEAMSAIEMMDVKMDAGMVCNLAKKKFDSFDQAVKTGAVKVNDFTWEEKIEIIDATLSCLVTWSEGHSLAQTVFTNVYLHSPEKVEDPCIKAFSFCMLKTVELIKDRINRASIFEEEDFQPMSYGFKMAPNMTDSKAMSLMKEVEDDFNRTIKATRIKEGQERNEKTENENQIATAIYSRIKFCRMLFISLTELTREKCSGLDAAKKSLSQLSDLLDVISKSLNLLTGKSQQDSDYPVTTGFEPLLNQRLLPPTFPRYTRIKTAEETQQYFRDLINNLQHICSVTECDMIHSALEFFTEFSKTSPCVLSRSLLQLTYFSPNRRIFGTEMVSDVIRDQIRQFVAPPAIMQQNTLLNNNQQAKDFVDSLLNNASRVMCSIINILGLNRARQRDRWGHLLDDLATLQDEADKVDAYLHNTLLKSEPSRQHLAFFGTWVLYHTVKVMITYLLSGFELELYGTYEYYYIFWYLYECLYGWLVSTISRADSSVQEHEAVTEQQLKTRNNKKNKKKRVLKARQEHRERLLCQAQQNMCGGYFKALMGFKTDGKMKDPNFPFDNEEYRYNHRFAPFGSVVTPPLVQYSQFKEMVDFGRYEHKRPISDMYMTSCQCFQHAKALLERINNPTLEIINLIKVAKTNYVVIKLLAGGHKKDSQEMPEFDFSTHNIFPTIKV